MTTPLNDPRTPPYKLAGLVLPVLAVVVLVLLYFQFRGEFQPRTQLTMVADRSGLSFDLDAKVTYNGVEIGRVTKVDNINVDGEPKAKIIVEVDPKYIKLIPANVAAEITATTVFGNKYVSFSSPKKPVAQRISSSDVIDVSHVTTEFNTLFETVVDLSEKVDPVKLNATLTATAQALDGLGDRFGQSIIHGNQILGDLNPQMPQTRSDINQFADLAKMYADAAPDLFEFLRNAVTTARTLSEQQSNLDAALMAAVGFGNSGPPIFEKGGPYLIRALQDLIPTSQLLNEYSPELFCTIRNYAELAPKVARAMGGYNGYSLSLGAGTITGAPNPYIYPDNLPRVNASGGPEGRPGCWQKITRELWPAPYLVMDTGASIAPYNHFELGQPIAVEYVWGRQIGEYTINP